MHVQVSQISILCFCDTANCFLSPAMGFQRSPNTRRCSRVLNSSSKKSTISSRYRLGFSSKYSHKASNIGGVMLRGRPTPFEGAFVEPKWRRFDCIAKTKRSLQPTTSAILAGGQLLKVISWICTCYESARFGAIMGSDCYEREHHRRATVLSTVAQRKGPCASGN